MERSELLSIPIERKTTLSSLLKVVNHPLYRHKTMVPFGEDYSICKRLLTDLYSASIQNGISPSDYVTFYIKWDGRRADFNGTFNRFGKGYEGRWWAWIQKRDSKKYGQ